MSTSEPNPEQTDKEVKGEAPSELSQQEASPISNSFSASFQFIGPLPPPAIVEQYNRAAPDGANRIFLMAEREQEHRQKMQEKLVEAQVRDMQEDRKEKRLGQIFGLAIGLFSIAAGSVTAARGAQVPGALIGSSGVVGLVSVFVIGRRDQNSWERQLEASEIEDEDTD